MNYTWQNITCAILIIVGVTGVIILIQYFQRQAQQRVWGEIAVEFGLVFEPGRFPFSSPLVKGMYQGHALVLDTYTRVRRSGKSSSRQTFTRIVMTINNSSDLRLMLYEESVASRVEKWIGAEDIQVGDADIDHRFMVKGPSEEEVRHLFASEGLRHKLLSVSSINLTLEGAAIRFEQRGVEKGIERIRSLFDLMSEIATRVEQIGSKKSVV